MKRKHTYLLQKIIVIFVLSFLCWGFVFSEASEVTGWAEEMGAFRRQYNEYSDTGTKRAMLGEFLIRMERQFPVEWDWFLQDFDEERTLSEWLDNNIETEMQAIETVLKEAGVEKDVEANFIKRFDSIRKEEEDSCIKRLEIYTELCRLRRAERLKLLIATYPKIVFTKHYNLGGSHYAYTEGQSDAQNERHFVPGSELCLMQIDGRDVHIETLLGDRGGVIRDPDVSYDGKKILFAWKKSDREDDYHLYEMDVESRQVRAMTEGLGFTDYEGAYLPNGDIVFNSTRCVQTVDCWWTEVSNLYICDGDGRFMRRLTFDQVHTNYPAVLEDGRIVYTRWDYNDRGQIYPQPLFQMNSDGTGQTEFYGNNSWFPTTILHARGIAGSHKLAAIATGHHSLQKGKLILIDAAKGRQEAEGVQLIVPVRETEAVKIDVYGQDGEQFQYPYAISEEAFIVSYLPRAAADRSNRFKIYFMTIDGRRELLAADPYISCNQPVPLKERKTSYMYPSTVDYSKNEGVYYLQDIYAGPGLKGIERGTVKELRVVVLEFRAAGIGQNGSNGPGGGALASTPISIDNGSWDVKRVLGSATVYSDGSACFSVPARTPVYFQAIDERGFAVQTMRTWSTLQPGETNSCVGCHEAKDTTPLSRHKATAAMKAGPETLKPFYGSARGFSFAKEIQPILDKHCVRCHNDRSQFPDFSKNKDKHENKEREKVFSLRTDTTVDEKAKRKWSDSYLALTQKGKPNRIVQWLNVQSVPSMLEPYYAGAAKSELMKMLLNGHEDVKLSKEETEKIACWIDLLVPYCGDYTEANAWSAEEMQMYQHFLDKRRKMEEIEKQNIAELLLKKQGVSNG